MKDKKRQEARARFDETFGSLFDPKPKRSSSKNSNLLKKYGLDL